MTDSLKREDLMEGIRQILEGMPQPKKTSLFNVANMLSGISVVAVVGLFNVMTTQATTNATLERDFVALSDRVTSNADYIRIHEPQIEHRDTRQCGHSSKQDLAIRNIHKTIRTMSDDVHDLADVPAMNCGVGAGK